MKFYYTYVIQSIKDGNFYTGFTEDLRRRLQEHNKRKTISTKWRVPLRLIYYEACLDIEDAKRRERYLKSGIGKKFIKMRLKKYFTTYIPESPGLQAGDEDSYEYNKEKPRPLGRGYTGFNKNI